MSNEAINLVYETTLPGIEKSVMLHIADKLRTKVVSNKTVTDWVAKDEDTTLAELSERTGFGRTAVNNARRKLVSRKILIPKGQTKRGENIYEVDPTKLGKEFDYTSGDPAARRQGSYGDTVPRDGSHPAAKEGGTLPPEGSPPAARRQGSIYKEEPNNPLTQSPISGGAVLNVSGPGDELVEPVRKMLARWVASGLKGVKVDDDTVREFARQLGVARITPELLQQREESAVEGLHFGLSAGELVTKLKPYVKAVPKKEPERSSQPPIMEVLSHEPSVSAEERSRRLARLGVFRDEGAAS